MTVRHASVGDDTTAIQDNTVRLLPGIYPFLPALGEARFRCVSELPPHFLSNDRTRQIVGNLLPRVVQTDSEG